MDKYSIKDLQFHYRAFVAYLSELLRLNRDGHDEIDGMPIGLEISDVERRLNDLKLLVKRRIIDES